MHFEKVMAFPDAVKEGNNSPPITEVSVSLEAAGGFRNRMGAWLLTTRLA